MLRYSRNVRRHYNGWQWPSAQGGGIRGPTIILTWQGTADHQSHDLFAPAWRNGLEHGGPVSGAEGLTSDQKRHRASQPNGNAAIATDRQPRGRVQGLCKSARAHERNVTSDCAVRPPLPSSITKTDGSIGGRLGRHVSLRDRRRISRCSQRRGCVRLAFPLSGWRDVRSCLPKIAHLAFRGLNPGCGNLTRPYRPAFAGRLSWHVPDARCWSCRSRKTGFIGLTRAGSTSSTAANRTILRRGSTAPP